MKTTRRLFLFALLLLPVAIGFAQDKFAAVPATQQPFVDHGEISGAVMLVAEPGPGAAPVGRRHQRTRDRPADAADDLFWIASMSKPITAVGVALLVDEGKLAFDDPVEKYLPEFRQQWMVAESAADRRVLVRVARPVTVRDLLTHTSGLGEYQVTIPHWTLAE
jgi:CubicO group peptidase (beta-lactamase class C family)